MTTRRSTLIGLVVAGALLLVAACGSNDSASTSPTTPRIGSTTTTGTPVTTFSDPSQPVVVEVGQLFAVELESNATTGYQWRIVEAADPGVVAALDSAYLAPDTTLIGAPGRQVFDFRAVAAGTTVMTLRYQRQDPAADDQLATFTVTVS